MMRFFFGGWMAECEIQINYKILNKHGTDTWKNYSKSFADPIDFVSVLLHPKRNYLTCSSKSIEWIIGHIIPLTHYIMMTIGVLSTQWSSVRMLVQYNWSRTPPFIFFFETLSNKRMRYKTFTFDLIRHKIQEWTDSVTKYTGRLC